MIFDSQEQKNYVIKCVASCREWTHQESLQLSNQFDLAIQNGTIRDPKKTPKLPEEKEAVGMTSEQTRSPDPDQEGATTPPDTDGPGGMKPPKPIRTPQANNNQGVVAGNR